MAKQIPINGEALRRELAIRKLDMKELSEEMSFEKQYLNNCTCPSGGSLSLIAVNYLEKVYGILPKSYMRKEKSTIDDVEAAPGTVSIDYNKLYETIYNAVYTAVKKAWENE